MTHHHQREIRSYNIHCHHSRFKNFVARYDDFRCCCLLLLLLLQMKLLPNTRLFISLDTLSLSILVHPGYTIKWMKSFLLVRRPFWGKISIWRRDDMLCYHYRFVICIAARVSYKFLAKDVRRKKKLRTKAEYHTVLFGTIVSVISPMDSARYFVPKFVKCTMRWSIDKWIKHYIVIVGEVT